jgi:tripartite-type tricarboxylate transporter receptor subunit TctC
MKKGKFRFLVSLITVFIILLFIAWTKPLHSQENYPTRPINIIIAVAPGGGTDTALRLLTPHLKKKWGVAVNVISKPGGNTIPANMDVYSADPDGYTVLADQEACSSMVGLSMKELPFKVMDRTFIGTIVRTPMLFMVPSASPYKSLEDVIVDVKKDPKQFTWTSIGGTGTVDLLFRQLFKVAGVDASKTQSVLIKGGSQSAVLVGGGHVKIGGTTIPACRALVKSGAIRILAIARERNSEFPDVPTTAELGYPTINAASWVGFSGPPKLPPHIVNKWEKALKEILEDPEVITGLNKIGSYPFYSDSRGMKEWVKNETVEMEEVFGRR